MRWPVCLCLRAEIRLKAFELPPVWHPQGRAAPLTIGGAAAQITMRPDVTGQMGERAKRIHRSVMRPLHRHMSLTLLAQVYGKRRSKDDNSRIGLGRERSRAKE